MANEGNLGRLARYFGNTSDLHLHLPDTAPEPGRSLEHNRSEADGDEPRADNFVPQEVELYRRIDHRVGVDQLSFSVSPHRPPCADYLPPSCGLSTPSEFP